MMDLVISEIQTKIERIDQQISRDNKNLSEIKLEIDKKEKTLNSLAKSKSISKEEYAAKYEEIQKLLVRQNEFEASISVLKKEKEREQTNLNRNKENLPQHDRSSDNPTDNQNEP